MCGHLGHEEEFILLVRVIEETQQIQPMCRFCRGVSGQMQRKLNLGNNGCKECGFFKKHFKNDEGNKSILDQFIELEIVRVG